MEAIISVARMGKSGLIGSRMYTTTFPCHNCARHIVAAGISEVYYIEPYAKSLALDLHDDAISQDSGERETKVVFLQYEGVTPKNILRLFNMHSGRKVDGALKTLDKRVAEPVYSPALDGFNTYEQMIVRTVEKAEKEGGVKKGSQR